MLMISGRQSVYNFTSSKTSLPVNICSKALPSRTKSSQSFRNAGSLPTLARHPPWLANRLLSSRREGHGRAQSVGGVDLPDDVFLNVGLGELHDRGNPIENRMLDRWQLLRQGHGQERNDLALRKPFGPIRHHGSGVVHLSLHLALLDRNVELQCVIAQDPRTLSSKISAMSRA